LNYTRIIPNISHS